MHYMFFLTKKKKKKKEERNKLRKERYAFKSLKILTARNFCWLTKKHLSKPQAKYLQRQL